MSNSDDLFRFRETTPLDPELLRIHEGDIVLFENSKYKITSVGARWLRAERISEPGSQYSLKKSTVVKLHDDSKS